MVYLSSRHNRDMAQDCIKFYSPTIHTMRVQHHDIYRVHIPMYHSDAL
jgi:hypothetical protein